MLYLTLINVYTVHSSFIILNSFYLVCSNLEIIRLNIVVIKDMECGMVASMFAKLIMRKDLLELAKFGQLMVSQCTLC